MQQNKSGGPQKAFAIVNVIFGVILTMTGFILFVEEPLGAFVVLMLGVAFWATGAYVLNIVKKYGMEQLKKVKIVNLVFFILSCIMGAAALILPIIAPMF